MSDGVDGAVAAKLPWGETLPFAPTPSASIAGRTLQESTYAQRIVPRSGPTPRSRRDAPPSRYTPSTPNNGPPDHWTSSWSSKGKPLQRARFQ